jgi:hypothetical protein
MFYAIASKIPFIESDKSKRKILKIFIIGSVLYVLLHYYLYSSPINGMLSTVKQYLYYLMFADFGIAYFLSSQSVQEENEEDSDDGQLNEYTPEQIRAIQMEQMRRAQSYQMEMQRQQMAMMQQNNDGNNDEAVNSNKSPFVKKKEKDSVPVADKKSSEKEKSQEGVKKENEKKVVKKSEEGTDTCIPVYMGKN